MKLNGFPASVLRGKENARRSTDREDGSHSASIDGFHFKVERFFSPLKRYPFGIRAVSQAAKDLV
jgi:hypothetical protein